MLLGLTFIWSNPKETVTKQEIMRNKGFLSLHHKT